MVTRDQMDQPDVQSVKQALRYSAGVTPETRANFSLYDIMFDRGFILNRYLDGMRLQGDTGFVTPQAELYGIQRAEVLRGPASMLYGASSLGGLVNMVSKRPLPIGRTFGEFQIQGGSYEFRQAAFDVGGPIGDQVPCFIA